MQLEVELRFKEVNYSPPKEEGVFLEILDKLWRKTHMNILVRGNRSSGKSETDSPEHWKPPNASLLA